MSVYQNYCTETLNAQGGLQEIRFHYPENFNFGYDVVDRIAAATPDKKALVWCNTENEERIFSFGEIRDCSNRVANVFSSAGIGKGDRVMVALKRHYEYWLTAVALHKLGAVLIPVTHMLTEDDICYRLATAKVKAVVCTGMDQFPQKMLNSIKKVGLDCLLWTVQKDVPGFRNLTAEMETASSQLERRETLATDPLVMYFTSGTTGYPKAVTHDHSYPLAHVVTAKYWQQAEDGGLHFTVAETGWAKASWGKLYGQWLTESAVMVFDFDNFDPKQLMTVINRYGVTSFCAPPTVYRYLVRKGVIPMPTLRHASTAGELLNPAVAERFMELTGLPLMEGYGQTETTLLLANFKGDRPVSGSMGKPSPLYRIELQRRDGTPAAEGEIGEVVLLPPRDGSRQLGLFTSYLNGDEFYEHAWRGGVYHTGDAAWKDEKGYYWFHGRFDDIIKTGGFRVGPFEIENVLMEHPAVLECSVVGVPDELRGQAIKAFVVPAPGYEASRKLEKEIRDFCNSKLADYKWIRLLEFVSEMPKTISGKIRKVEQRQ
ncbi:MAG: acetyl-CoA synthetase [Clostridiales bacterium]|nr:acetyl-CoA synthetase [Clostridiales bacterium]